MIDHIGMNEFLYQIAIILFFASPIIAIAVTIYYFSLVPIDNKKTLKVAVVASLVISPFFTVAFENLTTGIGFRIFLFPFYYAKWVGILISVYFIAFQLFKNTIIKKQSLIVASMVILVYVSNSTMLEYDIDAKYLADTPNKSFKPGTPHSGAP